MAKAVAKAPTARDEEKALRQRWRTVDIAALRLVDASWNYDDAEAALKLQASLKRHGQIRPVLCVTPADGSTVVVDGRRLIAAMLALKWTRCMACDVGEAEAADIAALRLACELRFRTDYAKLSQAVHGFMQAGATVDRLASAGPFTVERIGYFNTLAVFDWSQFSEAAASDGQHVMDWDAEDLPPPPVHAAPEPEAFTAPEPMGPESFGGSDEGSHYMAQTKAADLRAPAAEAPAVPQAEAPLPAAAPAKGKAKKAAPPPGPSLFDDMDDVA